MYGNKQVFYEDKVDDENQAQEKRQSITDKVTTLLRWTGSILIVLSAVNFMLQGTDGIPPAYRYWIAMGFTLLLCSGGMMCAYLFKETKGARIFFGLGTAFLSVQVTQVAGMIYAYWHGTNALQPQYQWLQFIDVSPIIIMVDLALTVGLLVLVSYASFSILARNHLKTLIMASVVGNALLLLPIRDANWVPLLIVGLFIYIRHIEQNLHQDSSMRLTEGIAARAIILLPFLIILGRSLLHPVSYFLAIVVGVIAVVYFIYDIKRYTQKPIVLYISQWLGSVAAIATWFIIVEQFSIATGNPLISVAPVCLILFILSGQVSYHSRSYRNIASVLTVFLSYSAMLDQQTMAPLLAIAAGVLLSIAGLNYKEKIPFFAGAIAIIGGLLFYFDYALQLYSTAPWICSIVVGLLVILLASYLENKEKKILQQSRQYLNELKSWA